MDEVAGTTEANTLPPLPFPMVGNRDEDEDAARLTAAMAGIGGAAMAPAKGGLLGLDEGDMEHNNSSVMFGADTHAGGDDALDAFVQAPPRYTYKGTGAVEEVVADVEKKPVKLSKSVSMPTFDSAEVPPVTKFTGGRETLRFRPDKPRFLGNKGLPRQQQVKFNASSISPLLQQYLDHHSDTGGRKPQYLKRTEPVKWCDTGGVDTHVKVPSRASVCVPARAKRAQKRASERRERKKELRNSANDAKDRRQGPAPTTGANDRRQRPAPTAGANDRRQRPAPTTDARAGRQHPPPFRSLGSPGPPPP
jgi:hypothetical protein